MYFISRNVSSPPFQNSFISPSKPTVLTTEPVGLVSLVLSVDLPPFSMSLSICVGDVDDDTFDAEIGGGGDDDD